MTGDGSSESRATGGTVLGAASISFAGQLYNLGLSLVSGLVIARLIGPGPFGLFNLTRTLCEGTALVAKAGFDLAVVRYLGERQGDADQVTPSRVARRVVGTVFLLGSIPLFLAVIGGADLLQRYIYRFEGFAPALVVMAVAIPFMATSQVLGGIFRGFLRISPRVWVELLLQPTLRLLLFLGLFTVVAGLWSVIVATVMSFVISAVVLGIWAYRTVLALPGPVRRQATADWREVWHIGKYSIVLGGSVLMAFLVSRTDILLLGRTVSTSAIGQYAVAQMAAGLLASFNLALAQAAAPMMARLSRDGDSRALGALLHQHARWVGITTVPLFLILVFFGNELIRVVGDGYVAAEPIVAVLAMSQLVIALFSSAGYTLSMTGRHVPEFGIMAIGATVNVALNLLLIPVYGVMGAAYSALAGAIVANGVRAIKVASVYGVFPIGVDILRPAAICLLAFGAVAMAKFIFIPNGGLSVVVGCCLVSTSLYALGLSIVGLTTADREALRDLWDRSGRPGRS